MPELPKHLKELQVGQKIYLTSMCRTATAIVRRVNKNTVTLGGGNLKLITELNTNKLNHNGIIKAVNEYHQLKITDKKSYQEQRNAFSILKKFRTNFRFMPEKLSLTAKKKMLSILYQDRAGVFNSITQSDKEK